MGAIYKSKIRWKKYKIIITGSNSRLLSWELATFLTWRYITLDVFPLTFEEYLEFSNKKFSKENFLSYIEFWWLPEVVLESNNDLKKNYTLNLKNSIILKDIVWRYNIRDYSYFEKILVFLSENIWNITSLRKIEDYFKRDKIKISLATLSNYLKYLENVIFIRNCEKYDLQGKKVLEYHNKYYFNDIWIRNSIYYNIRFDIWKILENYVYNILVRNWYTVYFWEKDWIEIDFIAEKDWKKIYFQVTYLLADEKVYEREFWNLEKLSDNWPKYVLSMDDVIFNNEKGIKHGKVWEFEKILSF